MGWDVRFFGLNQAPEVKRLDVAQWLESWRLFHAPEANAWILEGQSQTDEITFLEEIKTNNRVLSSGQKSLLRKIETEIAKNGGYRELFDSDSTQIALLLSIELEQPVASFVSNDEGVDACFIFDRGHIARGRIEIDWNKALVFDADANAELEWLAPEGSLDPDKDLEAGYGIHEIVAEEAETFFSNNFLDELFSFDRELAPLRFQLDAQKGDPDPPYRSKSDVLRDELGISPSPQQLIVAFQPIIQSIQDPNFPYASNEHRYELHERVSGCFLFANSLSNYSSAQAHLKFYAGLADLLEEFSTYTRLLRPKPEFRKRSIDFAGWKRKLGRQWWRQKIRTKPWGRWLFP